MALSDKQFEDLKAQLDKKKQTLGEEGYNSFIQRAAQTSRPIEPVDNTGFVGDVGQGILKSAGELALGTGTIGRKIQSGISSVGEKLLGKYNPFQMGSKGVFDEESAQNTQAKELLKRDTTGEEIGGVIGDVASFAIPGMAVSKATKGANFLQRAAALGASDAAVTTAKSGNIDKDTLDAAIIGVAFPVAGKGVSAIKGAVLPSGADAGGRVVNSLIKPLLKDFSYGKNPGKTVATEGITANNLDDLAVKIGKRRQEVGNEIGTITKKSTQVFQADEALKPLDDAIIEASKNQRVNAPIIKRLLDLKSDILGVPLEGGDPTRKLKDLSAQELFELKKEVGDLTRWTGNASDDEIVNKALTRTYGNIKGQLDTIPGLAELNERYAGLTSAEIATKYRDKIASRQNLISVSGTGVGTAVALGSAIASGGAVVPILAGLGASGLVEASKTPAFKTNLAAWLAKSTEQERKEAFKQYPWLRGAVQTALFGEEENTNSLNK